MKQPRVLIVEDDEGIAEALRDALELEGYEVIVATNGAVGFERVLIQKPDIVIFDFVMPVTSGQDMVDSLQDRVGTMPIFIGMSASEYRTWCGSRSVQHFFRKPFNLDDMLKLVQRLLPQDLLVAEPCPREQCDANHQQKDACQNVADDERYLEVPKTAGDEGADEEDDNELCNGESRHGQISLASTRNP